MFYDNSEEVFLNWWDVLDGTAQVDQSGQVSHERPAGERPIESEGMVLQAEHSNAEGASESPNEDSGPYSRDGYHYRIPESNDPRLQRVSESGEFGEAKMPGMAQGYDLDVVRNVWEFAEIVTGNDPDLWRKDEFGNWIYRLDYGRRTSEFGWEIFDPGVGCHCQGVYAMRPMQWQSFVSQYEVMG